MMHISLPPSTATPMHSQAQPSLANRLVENLRNIGNSLLTMLSPASSISPPTMVITSLEEICYPRFIYNAEIRILAKKWGTEDIDTVNMVVKSLPRVYQNPKFRITDLLSEDIYLHRSQPLKHTDLESMRIGNNTTPHHRPGDGLYFLVSLEKEIHNPYTENDSIKLICRLPDLLRCGGKVLNDPFSARQDAVFIKLPNNETIPFESAGKI